MLPCDSYIIDFKEFESILIAVMQADTKVVDRDEAVSLMEPLRLGESSRHRATLTDLALDCATTWMRGLASTSRTAMHARRLVRSA